MPLLEDKYSNEVLLPIDLAYVKNGRQEINLDQLPIDELLTDIGRKTVAVYTKALEEANTVFINGPMGVFENEPTEYGTKSIWEAVANSGAFSLLGGGDSIAATNKYGLEKKFSYICTAGGALVRFLSGEELPVVKALRQAAGRYQKV